MRRTWMPLLVLLALSLTPLAARGEDPPPNDYGDPSTWLCRPGREDACAIDNSTTEVSPDGSVKVLQWSADPKASIDCFYVYPTVSRDPGGNSDMTAGPEELGVIEAQFARFASQCRPFAPLYRQFTLTALRARTRGESVSANRELGYNDVRDAWNHYLEHDNDGRGVVLIGHSQGSGVLTELIRNEIDGKPIQKQIVSALLLGTTIQVPPGKNVGATFEHMPLCREESQTGCIVTYVTFRSTIPPAPGTFFGVGRGESAAACTNPASLSGGSAELQAHLDSAASGNSSSAPPGPWADGLTVDTPFVSVPGLLTAECVSKDNFTYLELTVNADPDDPRTDDIVGDVVVEGNVVPSWGLHLIDVQVAMGDLVELVGKQAAAYTKTHMKALQ